jgi:hypothetical protein
MAASNRRVKRSTVSAVIRRSFRIGLWLGLIAGLAFALSKILRSRPESSSVLDLSDRGATLRPSTAWPPLETPTRPPATAPAPAAAPPPAPAPEPVKKAAAKKPAAKKAAPKKTLEPWVDPDGNICPQSHPVKGKLSSQIFQVPGNFAYDRTKPDRCYESADAAVADGMRAAKR